MCLNSADVAFLAFDLADRCTLALVFESDECVAFPQELIQVILVPPRVLSH